MASTRALKPIALSTAACLVMLSFVCSCSTRHEGAAGGSGGTGAKVGAHGSAGTAAGSGVGGSLAGRAGPGTAGSSGRTAATAGAGAGTGGRSAGASAAASGGRDAAGSSGHVAAGSGGHAAGGSGGHAAAGSGGRISAGAGGTAGSGADTACEQATDCGFGEIDHEILSKADCLCLFGCPHLPLNKQTIARRQSQYSMLCDPRTNGQGDPCPIDDCVPLPAAMCVDHVCAGPR